MNNVIIEHLTTLGYDYNSKAQNVIKNCDDWYSGKQTEFHTRTNVNGVPVVIDTMNFAKRCCADDANLCEIVEINAGENTRQFDGINEILEANRFGAMYRKQLERLAASGTVGCYIAIENADLMSDDRIRNGKIKLNYCTAQNIVPITVENDEITECAFGGMNIVDGKEQSVLVVFTQTDGKYQADTYIFDDKDNPISIGGIQLGEVKPFAILTSAEVNNIEDMEGYGYPKLYNAIPVLKAIDLAYNIMFGDLSKGEKLVFINELLSCIQVGPNGDKYLTKEQKDLFILLGEALPGQNTIIQEYNPEIRSDDITKVFETLLSLLSMSFGYGTKKYTFENGQIKTASEYIGEKQDCMQELNKQRVSAAKYIQEICSAIIWFSNTFNGTTWDTDEEIFVEFNDSYIEDKTAKLEGMRADALSFPEIPMIKVWYIMEKYNLSEEEAKKLIVDIPDDDAMIDTED